MLDTIFWWSGCIAWTTVAGLAVVCGLPDGLPYRGVTRLTFYGFGPVLWKELPENVDTFIRLKAARYHFLPLFGGWHLGLSLPTWLSRWLFQAEGKKHG